MENTKHEDSEFVRHIPCESCGSSDGNSLYTDGHEFCHVCDNYIPAGTEGTRDVQETKKENPSLDPYYAGTVRGLPARGISQETCNRYGYRVGKISGEAATFAPYYKGTTLVGCKVRRAGKEFSALGDMKNPQMFGQQLFGDGGKMLVLTEGERDAMAVSQAQGNKYPAASVPTGAKGAAKAVRANLEWLLKFDTIILFFDMDEPGQEAAKECAELLPPGRVKIARVEGAKDANDLLMQGRTQDIISAVWNAAEYRPDGLVEVSDLYDQIDVEVEIGLPWCFPTLTQHTYGRRWGEIYGVGAGTGIGKTDFFTQQMEYDINTLGFKVGLLMLEQKPRETVVRLAGKMVGKRLHVPDGSWTREERMEAVKRLDGKVTLYDSFGQTDWEVVANKIRFMAAQGIRLFYLDHLTAMADTADEKSSIEQIMKEMAGLANELDIIIHFISHLATPDGKPHEEGGQVSIRHFKGSRSIGFWSFFMFGLERDTQAEDPEERLKTTFRVVKDRFTGNSTGLTFTLIYDKETGRMEEETIHGF